MIKSMKASNIVENPGTDMFVMSIIVIVKFEEFL